MTPFSASRLLERGRGPADHQITPPQRSDRRNALDPYDRCRRSRKRWWWEPSWSSCWPVGRASTRSSWSTTCCRRSAPSWPAWSARRSPGGATPAAARDGSRWPVALVGWGAGQAYWSWSEIVAKAETPFPSMADVGFLVFPLAAAVAVVSFQREVRRSVVLACGRCPTGSSSRRPCSS